MAPRVVIPYSELVRKGLAELLEGDPTDTLRVPMLIFEQAVAAEPDNGGELLAAMQAVAEAAPRLVAVLQAADAGEELFRFTSLLLLMCRMMDLIEGGGGDFWEQHGPAFCQLALALVGAPSFQAALADPGQRAEALARLTVASRLLRQVVDVLSEHHEAKLRYVAKARAGGCSPGVLLGVLRQWAGACSSLRLAGLSTGTARHSLLGARTGFFLALHTVAGSPVFAAEHRALQAPEEQRRFAAAMVVALEDQLTVPAPAEGIPDAWSFCLWEAIQAAELPLFKPGMYDASPDAAGLCCPGRAQQLLEAAVQMLPAAPLARPESMPAAGHLQLNATLACAAVGFADWALPQWAEATAAGLADPPTCLFCGGPDLSDCCGDAKFRQCIKNKNKGRGGRSSSNGSTCSQGAASNRGRRLPEPPTRQALLAALKSIPAGVRVLIALLEDHRAILTKPESQRSEPELLAALHVAWAAKTCVRLPYILRSHACTPTSLVLLQPTCSWRTAEAPGGDKDSSLTEAGVAAAEALVRLGACLATSRAVPPAAEAANWKALPSKAFLYAERLLEACLPAAQTGSQTPTPALQRSALGLAFSTAKAALALAPRFARMAAQPRNAASLSTPMGQAPSLGVMVLGRLLSTVCFNAFYVLAPSMAGGGRGMVAVPDEESIPTTAAALSLHTALTALLPALEAVGVDEEEANEAILGPMLTPVTALAGRPGSPAGRSPAGMPLRAIAARPCAHLGCTRLRGASEWELPSQRCTRCHVATYCSRECQRADWPSHRTLCVAQAPAP